MEHAKTSKWIILDWDTAKTRRDETIHGTKVKMFASPYDVPEAVRAILDNDKKKFVIQFRYLSDEPTIDKQHNSYTVYGLGKFSKRLYSIAFDLDALQAENHKAKFTKKDRVVGAINKLLQDSVYPAPIDNYQLAKDALNAKYDLLAAA